MAYQWQCLIVDSTNYIPTDCVFTVITFVQEFFKHRFNWEIPGDKNVDGFDLSGKGIFYNVISVSIRLRGGLTYYRGDQL